MSKAYSNVIPFRPGDSDDDEISYNILPNKPLFRTTNQDIEPLPGKDDPVSIDDLYPLREVASPELGIALGLLSKAIDLADVALAALRRDEQIESDEAMQHIHASLPELFNCRALGDGYGEVVNALLSSFQNTNGLPLNQQQIVTVRLILSRTRSEPYMKFETALDLVEKLEEAELVVEPNGFDHLLDWLNG